jgi:hypothetical protein
MSRDENIQLMHWGKFGLKMLESDKRIVGESIVEWDAWKEGVHSHWASGSIFLDLTS